MKQELKERIEESGLKQKHLAKHLKVSQSLLSMFLSGERSMPEEKVKILDKLLTKVA